MTYGAVAEWRELVRARRRGGRMTWDEAHRRVLAGHGSIVRISHMFAPYWWVDRWPRRPKYTEPFPVPRDSPRDEHGQPIPDTPFRQWDEVRTLVIEEGHYLTNVPETGMPPFADWDRPTGLYAVEDLEDTHFHPADAYDDIDEGDKD